MNQSTTKKILFIITYAVFLVLIVVRFTKVAEYVCRVVDVIMPLFYGILIAFILNPFYEKMHELTNRLSKRYEKISDRLAKIAAIFAVYLTIVLAFILILIFIVPQIKSNIKVFSENAGDYLKSVQLALRAFLQKIGESDIDFEKLLGIINQKLDEAYKVISGALPAVYDMTSGVIMCIAKVFISIIISIYIIADKDSLIRQTKALCHRYIKQEMCDKMHYLVNIITDVMRNYFSGQMLDACLLGTLCFIGMIILRLDYAALTGVIIGVTALVPMVGAIIGAAIAGFIQLLISTKNAFIFILFIVILQQIDNNFIYPRVVGGKIGLPGIWVIMAVIIFGGLFGFVGMLLGVPIMTVIYTLVRNEVKKKS